MLRAHIQHVDWNRLAERNRVRLQQSCASRTRRRQLLEADRVAVKPRPAIEASDQSPVAVDFRERLLPGLPMQVVDVLRDDEAQYSHLLQLNQREMPRVRLRDRQRFIKFVVALAEPFFPSLFRIGHEALKAIHRRLAVLGPQPPGPAKRRYPAFDRHPRAGQCDRISRRQNCLRSFANFLVARSLVRLCHRESPYAHIVIRLQVTTHEIKVNAYAASPAASARIVSDPETTDSFATTLYIRGVSMVINPRSSSNFTSSPARFPSATVTSPPTRAPAGGAITRLTSLAVYRSEIAAPAPSLRALSSSTRHLPLDSSYPRRAARHRDSHAVDRAR